ncbi:MAG: dethiobiotin synthase [Rhodocyclales bacterium]|nr:dethiobiotin synthase [Rhodocyclales bacterium]
MKHALAWFVCGTDTGVGKTHVTCALLHAARNKGLSAVGMKPVAAGAELLNGEWLNDDVAWLRAASSFDPGLALQNPYCFREAIAPHLAAAHENVRIEARPIIDAFETLRARAEVVLIEGVGGFMVPLGEDFDSADLAVQLGAPVILVVGMRLGCINHSLLTCEAIKARGLRLAGWVANRIDPDMACHAENLAALRRLIQAPLLGELPFLPNPDPVSTALALTLPQGVQ